MAIAKLEVQVFALQEQLENEERFDLALINGPGRGRPKSGPFVGYVRCLLDTGFIAASPSPYTCPSSQLLPPTSTSTSTSTSLLRFS